MSSDDTSRRLAQLAATLDIHGARPERWPEPVRAKLSAFIAENEAAARLLAEARALGKVLAFAPRPSKADALEARILAAAASLPQAGAVVAFPRRQSGGAAPLERPVRSARRIWPELTLLAASLFLGLAIGLSGEALPALQNVAVIAGDDGALGAIAGLLFDPGGTPGQEAL